MNRVFENLLKARVRLSLIRGRGEEPDFPHEQIESHGHKTEILDMRLVGEAQGTCDISGTPDLCIKIHWDH